MRKASRTVTARIHRLSGQMNAIETMLRSRRSCLDVLNQLSAIRSGIDQVASIVFQTEVQKLASKKHITEYDIEQLTSAFNKSSS